ncbi:hypothetical protein MRB53_023404 [Persea americana]|uniref:Uncharacterized protein n=1 Tax=Persea americana TaxID=3435 RepID=A0ACC2LA65_PERAE|nr:hypothetical protein MRB53_023404 [Persea americana]
MVVMAAACSKSGGSKEGVAGGEDWVGCWRGGLGWVGRPDVCRAGGTRWRRERTSERGGRSTCITCWLQKREDAITGCRREKTHDGEDVETVHNCFC